jgi:hypothetical protein
MSRLPTSEVTTTYIPPVIPERGVHPYLSLLYEAYEDIASGRGVETSNISYEDREIPSVANLTDAYTHLNSLPNASGELIVRNPEGWPDINSIQGVLDNPSEDVFTQMKREAQEVVREWAEKLNGKDRTIRLPGFLVKIKDGEPSVYVDDVNFVPIGDGQLVLMKATGTVEGGASKGIGTGKGSVESEGGLGGGAAILLLAAGVALIGVSNKEVRAAVQSILDGSPDNNSAVIAQAPTEEVETNYIEGANTDIPASATFTPIPTEDPTEMPTITIEPTEKPNYKVEAPENISNYLEVASLQWGAHDFYWEKDGIKYSLALNGGYFEPTFNPITLETDSKAKVTLYILMGLLNESEVRINENSGLISNSVISLGLSQDLWTEKEVNENLRLEASIPAGEPIIICIEGNDDRLRCYGSGDKVTVSTSDRIIKVAVFDPNSGSRNEIWRSLIASLSIVPRNGEHTSALSSALRRSLQSLSDK